MYNYNRAVYQAEHERAERMLTASQRQVPYHLRRNEFKQAATWLARNVGRPLGASWSRNFGVVFHKLAVVYRRASTRAVGLVLNTLEGLLNLAPGR
jgi:hypothetical protein